jgi:hypothetical protein
MKINSVITEIKGSDIMANSDKISLTFLFQAAPQITLNNNVSQEIYALPHCHAAFCVQIGCSKWLIVFPYYARSANRGRRNCACASSTNANVHAHSKSIDSCAQTPMLPLTHPRCKCAMCMKTEKLVQFFLRFSGIKFHKKKLLSMVEFYEYRWMDE